MMQKGIISKDEYRLGINEIIKFGDSSSDINYESPNVTGINPDSWKTN